MQLGHGLGHLTYSTLVHPGDTWPEMRGSLATFVPQVRRRVAPEQDFGVSLRLSAASAQTLTDAPEERAALRDLLLREHLYVYTVNAFPYGPFKGRRVMEDVYEPDWSTDARVRYTTQVADILAEVAPASVSPSIQTAPLAFRPNVAGQDAVAVLVRNVLRVVTHLVQLERNTGRRVTLALEPEPYCFLETTEETVRFFEQHLYCAEAATQLARSTGLPLSEIPAVVRRHVGVVFDICHQSVQFEDIGGSLDLLVGAGVPIFKLQAAAALWVTEVDESAVEALLPFTDTIYLSQTTERRNGQLTRYLNLTDAITAWRDKPGGSREWRTHFHVPVFLDQLGPFRTTRSGIEVALDKHAATPLSDHLEIETYTWDVLPAALKSGDVTDYVCRELEWLQGRLMLGKATEAMDRSADAVAWR
jgi:hypothetical protein